jgi:hypothetical protein
MGPSLFPSRRSRLRKGEQRARSPSRAPDSLKLKGTLNGQHRNQHRQGPVVEYYNRVKANDPANSALILVPIQTTGLEADAC